MDFHLFICIFIIFNVFICSFLYLLTTVTHYCVTIYLLVHMKSLIYKLRSVIPASQGYAAFSLLSLNNVFSNIYISGCFNIISYSNKTYNAFCIFITFIFL